MVKGNFTKENKEVSTPPLKEAMLLFLAFLSYAHMSVV